jgi:hypothetical protein
MMTRFGKSKKPLKNINLVHAVQYTQRDMKYKYGPPALPLKKAGKVCKIMLLDLKTDSIS